MNTWIRMGLTVAQCPPALIDEIDREIPGARALIANAQKLEPLLKLAQPHVEALTPLVDQAKPHISALWDLFEGPAGPILKAAYPELMALLPTGQKILTFIEAKGLS